MLNGVPRILIIRLSAIGDVVRVLPALHALRDLYPSAQIDWVVEPKSAGVVEGHPALDQVLLFERSENLIEAARAFGMSPALRFRRVILPALLPNALPGLANLWLAVTKDSALVAVVGYQELALATRLAGASTKQYFLFFLAAAFLYLAITLVSNLVFSLLERRVRRGQPALA